MCTTFTVSRSLPSSFCLKYVFHVTWLKNFSCKPSVSHLQPGFSALWPDSDVLSLLPTDQPQFIQAQMKIQ